MQQDPEPDRLPPQLDTRVQTFTRWWRQTELELDVANCVQAPLFHYTDMAGLVGILRTETIWFTSIFHLNDPSELAHGIEIALGILQQQAEAGNESVKRFCHWMGHVLIKAGGEIFGFYIASFSQAGDDLSQWRAYADNARGAVLGLAPQLFAVQDGSTLAVNEKTLVAPVIYDQELCERRTREAITRAVQLIVDGDAHTASDDQREAFGKEMARQLAVPLFLYAVTCKHPAYAHERETRLIIMNDLEQLTPVTRMRTRGSDLVPYIPSPFRVRAPGAVTAVVIGPAAEAHAEDAVLTLIRTVEMSADIVTRSTIPYTAR